MTERAHQQREDSASSRRLAGGASHELNNILTAMYGYIDMGRLEAPSMAPFYFDCLYEACQRLKAYSDDLALYAERVYPEPQGFELAPVLDRLRTEFGSLQVRVAGEVGELWGSAEQLLVALRELCLNARRASPAPVVLEIRMVSHAEPCIEFAVLDSGLGLEPGTDTLFLEPHQRNREWGGKGLGLARAQGYAGSHRGWLELSNRPEGGCQAVLTVPVDARVPAA